MKICAEGAVTVIKAAGEASRSHLRTGPQRTVSLQQLRPRGTDLQPRLLEQL